MLCKNQIYHQSIRLAIIDCWFFIAHLSPIEIMSTQEIEDRLNQMNGIQNLCSRKAAVVVPIEFG